MRKKTASAVGAHRKRPRQPIPGRLGNSYPVYHLKRGRENMRLLESVVLRAPDFCLVIVETWKQYSMLCGMLEASKREHVGVVFARDDTWKSKLGPHYAEADLLF